MHSTTIHLLISKDTIKFHGQYDFIWLINDEDCTNIVFSPYHPHEVFWDYGIGTWA